MNISSEVAWLESLARKRRVLIVDDDEMVVSVLTKFCEYMNLEVDKCLNAECAIKLYNERSPYDAILIDLNLGAVGGGEVFKLIRSNDRDTPIAIISGFITDDVANKLMQLGPVTFIKKPIGASSPHLSGFFRSIGVI